MKSKEMEFWVSPELAEDIVEGSIMTLSVSSLSKMGSGYLVSADGVIATPSGAVEVGIMEVAQRSQALSDLSGAPAPDSVPIQSFTSPTAVAEVSPPVNGPAVEPVAAADPEPIVEPAPEPIVEPVPEPIPEPEVPTGAPAGLSFGERGPQLINGEETPKEMDDKAEPVAEVAVKPGNRKIAMSIKDLYDHLHSLDPELLKKDLSTGPVSRGEAVVLESAGTLGCGIDAYVKNICGGQLHLSDIDVRIRHGDSYDLSRVSPARLVSSVDLFEAVNGNLLIFIDGEEARAVAIKTERRLASIEDDLHSVDVYDGVDSVYDDIEGQDEYDEYDDLDPQMRVSGQSTTRQSPSVDNRFRRGIKSASDKARQHPGYDGAVIETPEKFKNADKINITGKDDGYEFDRIFTAIEHREAEISNSDIDWQGAGTTIAPSSKETTITPRDHVTVNKRN